MSRLDVFVARMTAQVKCLNWAAEEIQNTQGCVFELGLGNGRTYDHLRELFPMRQVFVFDRKVVCHPSCVPPKNRLILGELNDTLIDEQPRFSRKVALIHVDIGGYDPATNDARARQISPLLSPFMQTGGIIMSTDQLYVKSWETLELPKGVDAREGFLYRA